ncbi:MAG: glutamine-hydrolyzing GMP synthase, partial [Sneathiella sp.]|nr:glutamine-hydrolyzing GMP synthase [Sneathiella sp.]
MKNSILIIDFGSQVTQLIARRVREAGVYSEIIPFNSAAERLKDFDPAGIILSGGPASVIGDETPRAPDAVFGMGVPVLGICYGQQTMVNQLGGKVEAPDHREFGRAEIDVVAECDLFNGVWEAGSRDQVWMSHGDHVVAIPEGFSVVATSSGAPFAGIANDEKKFYGVQFHPEVMHTPRGSALLANFVHRICGLAGDWTMAAFKDQAIDAIRRQVGKGKVICGLSGGVDSPAVAVLIHQAIGDQLT